MMCKSEKTFSLPSFSSCLTILIFFFSCSQSLAQSSVWLVTKGDNKVYLGGTIHMLRPADYPLPGEYQTAYADADSLFFETDIDAMNKPETQRAALQKLMYTDGRTLEAVLNDEAYNALSQYIEKVGLPMMLLQNMKPGMLMSTLELLEFQILGFTPQGVDAHFHQRASVDGKAIGFFETVEVQVAILAEMGKGEESDFVLLSLRDLERIENDIESIIDDWRSGNAELLMQHFVADMKEATPDVYQSLLEDRNDNWMPEIEAMLDDADTEFVLVGVAHLIGQDGIVQQLRGRGYQIEQL